MEDVWGDESDEEIISAKNSDKIATIVYNEAFRTAKAKEEDSMIQRRFDTAFGAGAELGLICGEIYARIILICAQNKMESQVELRDLFLREVPQELGPRGEIMSLWERLVSEFRFQLDTEINHSLRDRLEEIQEKCIHPSEDENM